jgi:hypothetical protein
MFRTQSTKLMLAAATMTVALLAGCGGSSGHPNASGSPSTKGVTSQSPIGAVTPAAASSASGSSGSSESSGGPSSACDFLKNGPFKDLGSNDSASTIAGKLRYDANYIRTSFPSELHDDGNLLASMLDEGASRLDGGAAPNAALVSSIMQEHQAAYRTALGDFVRYAIVHCESTSTAP